jgi:hypothetical protein
MSRNEQADGFASGGQHGIGNGGEALFDFIRTVLVMSYSSGCVVSRFR